MHANVEDLRQAARRRLPRMLFDYVDTGSYGCTTRERNTADFDRFTLDQRVLVNVANRSLKTKILGEDSAMPLALGPAGSGGVLRRHGEVQVARAASKAGIPYGLTTAMVSHMEDVAAATTAPFWFQLYVISHRPLAESLIARAEAVGAKALILTVDATVAARREADFRSGFIVRPRPSLPAALDALTRWRWLWDVMLMGPKPRLSAFRDLPEAGSTAMEHLHFLGSHLDPSLSWDSIRWIRDRWKGKFVIKGILNVPDAQRAVDIGADGIVVSNHGGRQLDSARSSIMVLPEIARAVGHQTEVLFDSGIRRGQHIAKALALGAHACLIGRAYLYGLGAGGEAGVTAVIDHLRAELDSVMGHIGVTSINQLRSEGANLIRLAD
jgi:L-lactate dehydrogenase (cytochrome)